MRASQYIWLPLFGLLTACSQTALTTSVPREVTGHLDTRAFAVSRGAVVVAVSDKNRLFSSGLTRKGGFRLSLPTGEKYRLILAEPTSRGYRAVSRIRWLTSGGTSRWAMLKEGPRIRFAMIQPSAHKANDREVEKDDDSDCDAKKADDVDEGTVCDADHWKAPSKDSDDDNDEDRDGKGSQDGGRKEGGGKDDLVATRGVMDDGPSSGSGSVSDCEGHDKEGSDKDGVEGDDSDKEKKDSADDVDCTVVSADGGTVIPGGGNPDGGTGGNPGGGNSDGGTGSGTPDAGTGGGNGTDGGTVPACGVVGTSCTTSAVCCIGTGCQAGLCTGFVN